MAEHPCVYVFLTFRRYLIITIIIITIIIIIIKIITIKITIIIMAY